MSHVDTAAPAGADVVRSGLWAFGGQIASLGATALFEPFTIRLLGPARFGIWSLLVSGLSYLQLADLGMSVASTRIASSRYAAGDRDGEASVVWGALAITATLTVTVCLTAGLLTPFLVVHVMRIPHRLQSSAELAFVVMLVSGVAVAIAGVLNTPLQVRLRWRSLTLATSGPAVLVIAVAPLALTVVQGGLVTLSVLTVTAALLTVCLDAAIGLRLLPRLARPRLQRDTTVMLLRFGAALSLAAMVTVPLMTLERFLLASDRSSAVVGYYSVAVTLAAALAVFPAAVTQPLIPALTRLQGSEHRLAHDRLCQRALITVTALGTPAALALMFVAKPFLRLWAGPVYAQHSSVPLIILTAGTWIALLGYVPVTVVLAAGRAKAYAVVLGVELLPFAGLAVWLCASFGADGAAVAVSARNVINALAFFALARRTVSLGGAVGPMVKVVLLNVILALGLTLAMLVTSTLAERAGVLIVLLGLYTPVVLRLLNVNVKTLLKR